MEQVRVGARVRFVGESVVVGDVMYSHHGQKIDTVEATCKFLELQAAFRNKRIVPLDDHIEPIGCPSAPRATIASIRLETRDTPSSPSQINTFPRQAVMRSGFDLSTPLDLCLEAGNIVLILGELEGDWYEGEARGKRGRFPRWKIAEWAEVMAAAEGGDAAAQRELGTRYKWAYGVEKDMVMAAKWYRRSAEQGDPGGQFCIAWCYEHGGGVEEDVHEAARWYAISAKQGDLDAQYNLGVCYDAGAGVELDSEKALFYWRNPAAQGHIPSMHNVGAYYLHGAGGLDADSKEAAEWFRRAAERGDPDSQWALAYCLYQEEHDDEALHWTLLAAEQKQSHALQRLQYVMPDLPLSKLP